ncbi:Protein-lysine N-methyltransferase efm4 [Paraconiothyrium brasiliense]|uniref:Protein-lysine N-methyltransferase efm4 n=1 Tax=Paraconiothyrium brasiliense TaxID=300254 RepID=A0ABR3R839_9PLEO
MTSKMERLPQELVDLIYLYISHADRCALRLVSKQLYFLTLTNFGNTVFFKRVTTLGVASLNQLLQASGHAQFSGCVTLLDVKLLNYEDYDNLVKIDRVGIYPPPKRLPRVPQVKTGDIRQESKLLEYMRTQQDPTAVIHPLARALKRFRNLKTIRLRVNGLTLYGNLHILAEDEVYQSFMSACFRAVLEAIVRSGVKLQEFTLIKGNSVRPMSKSANLDYRAFALSFPLFQSLGNAFSGLKSLRLSIRTDPKTDSRSQGWEIGVKDFITTTSALETLTLCMDPIDCKPHFRATMMRSICRSVNLPMLKSLQLYGCAMDELDLVTLMKTHAPTLRRLLISDAELRSGTWRSILNLLKNDLGLEYLRFQYLQQIPQSIRWFAEDTKQTGKLIIDATKSGDKNYMNEKLSQAMSSLAAAIQAWEISGL